MMLAHITRLKELDNSESTAGKDKNEAALSRALYGLLEEASTNPLTWTEREDLHAWLRRNRDAVVTAEQKELFSLLEKRLQFSFLSGISWMTLGGGETVSGTGGGGPSKNLVGLLEPPGGLGPAGPRGLMLRSYGSGKLLGRGSADDGGYTSVDTDEEAVGLGGTWGGGGMSKKEGGSSGGQGLPSLLEQGAVDVTLLGEADHQFLLQPTPRGLKTYCVIQRSRSAMRTFFKLFLQEQRELPASSNPGGLRRNGSAHIPNRAPGPAISVGGGNVVGVGDAGTGSVGGGGDEREEGGVGGSNGGEAGEGLLRGAQFLLSSKRNRSGKPRATMFIWSKAGVWKEKNALAKVETRPSKKGGTLSSPSLIGEHRRLAMRCSPIQREENRVGGGTGPGTASVLASATLEHLRGGGLVPSQRDHLPELADAVGCSMTVFVSGEGDARLLTATVLLPNPSLPSSAENASMRQQNPYVTAPSGTEKKSAVEGMGKGEGWERAREGEEEGEETLLSKGLRALEENGTIPPGLVVLHTKQAKWSAWQGCHTLSFERGGERVREPSRKNVSLINLSSIGGDDGRTRGRISTRETGGGINGWGGVTAMDEAETEARRSMPSTLQIGKIGEDYFSVDFGWPLSPFQAFVTSMSIFDG